MCVEERIDVDCGWGEGIDVLLTNKGIWYMLYDEPSDKDRATHGFSKSGSMELTRKQARQLASDLIRMADACDELDASVEEYFEKESKLKWVVVKRDDVDNVLGMFPSYKDACDVYEGRNDVVITKMCSRRRVKKMGEWLVVKRDNYDEVVCKFSSYKEALDEFGDRKDLLIYNKEIAKKLNETLDALFDELTNEDVSIEKEN
jgi:hypothetical protein